MCVCSKVEIVYFSKNFIEKLSNEFVASNPSLDSIRNKSFECVALCIETAGFTPTNQNADILAVLTDRNGVFSTFNIVN